MTRRGYQRCVNVEEICEAWGGGHMCTGRCGLVHLHGRAWSWWRCPVCHRLASAQRIADRMLRQLEYWYAPLERDDVLPASVKRREQRQREKEQT